MSNYGTMSMTHKAVGGGMVVFPVVYDRYRGGGMIDTSGTNPITEAAFKVGDLIPAGTPVKFAGAGKNVTIVKCDADSTAANGVNGLIENDIYISEGIVAAPCTVVYKGQMFCDRVTHGTAKGLSADIQAQLTPQFQFISES